MSSDLAQAVPHPQLEWDSLDGVIEQDEVILKRTLEQPFEGIYCVRLKSSAAPGWIILYEVQVCGTSEQ